MNYKAFIKLQLLKLGLDLRFLKGSKKYLFDYQIDFILDIGANHGQFAIEMLKSGYKGDILSIEPSSSAYEVLIKNSKSYSNWRIFRRCAIGSSTGKVILNLSKNSQSSSILDISDEHVKFANDSVYVGSETIDMITVDYLYDELQLQNRRIFLKVDTQGYEGEVLLGSIKSIHTFTFVSLELSTTQLYIGAPNYYELMSTMSSHGFVLFSMEPVFFDNKSGRVLQYDAIFINSRSL